MKKLIVLGIFFSGVITTQVFTRSAGADPGHTGAPGDNTCVSCHGGNVNNAPARPVIKLLESGTEVSAIEPNTDYTVEITYSIGGMNNRAGFQLVALNQNNQNTGSLIVGTGTRLVNGGQRTYITHSSARSGANVAWTATWNSGEVSPTDVVTFYAASRSNAQVAGISNQAFTVTTPTNSLAKIEKENLKFYPSLVTDQAFLTGIFSKASTGRLGIFNMRGQLVQEEALQVQPGEFLFSYRPSSLLLPGNYVARISVGGYFKVFRFKKI